jgi:hypothetical protein
VPLDVTVDRAGRVIKTRGWGEISEADLLQTRERLLQNHGMDLSYRRLCDLSQATSISISEEALRQWADDPVGTPPVPHAVICTAPLVLKRVLNYVSYARSNHHDVSVFPSDEAASAWISRSSPMTDAA